MRNGSRSDQYLCHASRIVLLRLHVTASPCHWYATGTRGSCGAHCSGKSVPGQPGQKGLPLATEWRSNMSLETATATRQTEQNSLSERLRAIALPLSQRQ